MPGVLDQLRRFFELSVALSASRIRFHFLGKLAARIPSVHFVTGNAGDPLPRLAALKTFGTKQTLILVSSEAR